MVECNRRLLKPNHRNKRPQRMLFVDSETKFEEIGPIQRHEMDIAWTYYCRRAPEGGFHEGTWTLHESPLSLHAMIDSLVLPKTTLYIFAHNAFFDMQASGFFRYFTSDGWRLSFIYDSGLTYILTIRKGNRKITVLSTTNFFSTSLENLGKAIGHEKTKVDFESSSREALIEYCKNDTEIIVQAMEQYIELLDTEDLGNFGLTRASQSFNAYRHRFMDSIIALHDSEHVTKLERHAYMGGRTEAFFIGEHPGNDFVSLDVNSMYPFIMKTYDMPAELVEYKENVSLTDAEGFLEQFCAVAEVKLSSPIPAYAKRFEGKIVFPIGDFTTYLTTPGLEYALEHGHAVSVEKLALYRPEMLFSDYVDHFYKMRMKYKEAGNEVYSYMVKIFMNSLYGKFGQQQPIESKEYVEAPDDYFRADIVDTVTGEIETQTLLMNTLITSQGTMNGSNSLVAIPAHITEYGRMMLWRIIEGIGVDKVLYCDTDSVKIEHKWMSDVKWAISDKDLGALKIEEQFDRFTIHGAKDYETDSERKLKGVPKNAMNLGHGTYKYPMFQGQSTHLRLGEMDAYLVREVTKHNTRVYSKGHVNPDGRVLPYRFFDFL